jgi:heterodisulfide reductase subunit D
MNWVEKCGEGLNFFSGNKEGNGSGNGHSGFISGDFLIKDLSKQQIIEINACVNCGECLNYCPIVEATGSTEFSPPARIRMFKGFIEETHGLKAKIFGSKGISIERWNDFKDKMWTCALCGSCGEVCTVGIDGKKLWWSLRKTITESEVGMPDPVKPAVDNFNKYHNPFPKPLTNRYKFWLPDDVKVADKAEVGFYEGCGGAWDAFQSAENAIRLLAAGGPVTQLDPEDAWCCGFPQVAGSGDWSVMPEIVKHLCSAIEKKGIKKLALICPMCRDIFKYLYPKYIDGPMPFEPVMALEVVADYIKEGKIKFTKELKEKVSVHDPCALARPHMGEPIFEPLRDILKAIPGVEIVELERTKELSRCCGGSAGKRPLHPDLVVKMAKNVMNDAKNVGADTLVTSCTTCYLVFAGRTHFTPHPTVDEYKYYEEPIKINDLLGYAAACL